MVADGGVADGIGFGQQGLLVVLIPCFGAALVLGEAQAVALVVERQRQLAGNGQTEQAVVGVVAEAACAGGVGFGLGVAVGVVTQGHVQTRGGIVARRELLAFVVDERAVADQRVGGVVDLFASTIADRVDGVIGGAVRGDHLSQAIGGIVSVAWWPVRYRR